MDEDTLSEEMELLWDDIFKKPDSEQPSINYNINDVDYGAVDRCHNNFLDDVYSDESVRPMAERWLESCPYNIFFTPYRREDDSTKERLWIRFEDLLDPSLGNLESTFATNFNTSYPWLAKKYISRGLDDKPLTLITQEIIKYPDHVDLPNWTYYVIEMPQFGSHNGKVMIFAYDDGSVRVVVHSASFIDFHWTDFVNCFWISPKCMPLKNTNSSGDSITNFKTDLINYLEGYKLDIVNPWIEKIKGCDMSHIKAFFIGSLPGEHNRESKLGFFGVEQALKRYAAAPDNNTYRLLIACSILGSYGRSQESNYITDDIMEVFSANRDNNENKPDFSIIYPCMKDVWNARNSLTGFMYSSRFHSRQEWISSFLNKWKMDSYGRTLVMPRVKVYTRISDDYKKISYFIMGSQNLTKSAWGSYMSPSTLRIRSFEAAVLLLPELLIDIDYFPLTEEENNGLIPKFYLPYDLPLVPYEKNDLPFFVSVVKETLKSLYLKCIMKESAELSHCNNGEKVDSQEPAEEGNS